MMTPVANAVEMNQLMVRYGVKFGIYKNGTFKEQLFPFDVVPRVITKAEFDVLERGLIQRVDALNRFLLDIYGAKNILRDGVVPEDFVFLSSGYLPQCEGIVPSKGIFTHISGIDLVQAKDKSWYILEDNLRMRYEKYRTTVNTSAEEALAGGAGVCQDYTHIFLAICRRKGIPCRYCAGLAACDGETHSWAEIYDGAVWHGIDPTNNCLADESYLKLSHGRDFRDCAIDRGIFLGAAFQTQRVDSSLIELEQ